MNHPNTRKQLRCPFCNDKKDQGTVVCWHCYRRLEMKYGNPQAEQFLDKFEASLPVEG